LFLTGRTAECHHLRRGQHLSPEIDNELVKHPAVRRRLHGGTTNDEWGEEVRAGSPCIRTYAPTPELAQALLRLRPPEPGQLQAAAWRRLREDIPRSEAGKVQRRQVAAAVLGRPRQARI